MKLTFAGTRGMIKPRNARHRMHTALVVEHAGRRVQIDCGRDWAREPDRYDPEAFVLTHAHPDHAEGLEFGSPKPVHAPPQTWDRIDGYPIDPDQRHTLAVGRPAEIAGITFTPFEVEHSLRCPAVCYRVEAGGHAFLYAPDVVYIHQRDQAFAGVELYIGDGATIEQSMVRKRGDRLIGHSPVQTQLTWCETFGVPRAIITHCGSQIVAGDERTLGLRVAQLGQDRGVEASIAYDTMELELA